MKYFRRGQPSQHLARQVIDFYEVFVDFFLGDGMKAGALGQIASDVAVEVFVPR